MSHKTWIVLFVLVASVTFVNSFTFFAKEKVGSVGGGVECALCTIASSLVEQVSEKNEQSVEELLDELCDYFPYAFATTCNYFVNTYGDVLIQLFANGLNPDEVCLTMEFCTNSTCGLYRPSKNGHSAMETLKPKINKLTKARIQESPWDWITNLINTLANKHEPVVDYDGDLFSTIETLRGADWRGRDCSDDDILIYPGTKINDNPSIDSNCNGIYGTDSNGNSYEDLLCSKYKQFGTIVLGDSAGAHFEIPPSYMNASEINKSTYSDLLTILEDEFDWPQRSAYTAWEGTYDSIYRYMWQRNHCNFRDYQNLGVNGCRSGAMASNEILSLARNQSRDQPALLFFELVGNDVCYPDPTLDAMTTPQEFYVNIMASLNYLNNTLPKGSHVIFVGVADGRVLYDNLYNRTHPLGISYVDMYNYLNCLQISPCWVWMNEDENIRNAGSQRAQELNVVYGEIIKNHTFVNFDMTYYDFPFPQISEMWKAQGGEVWQLIEPVDGFHPNQIAHGLIAEYFWNTLLQEHPDFLGDENPNNDLIEKIFGDQGGY